jgi:hypothetical protein
MMVDWVGNFDLGHLWVPLIGGRPVHAARNASGRSEPSFTGRKRLAQARTDVNGTPASRPMMVVHKSAAKGTAAASRTDELGASWPAKPMTKVLHLKSLPNENPEEQGDDRTLIIGVFALPRQFSGLL